MRIADFGVSKALEHFKANNVKNTLVGTPLYLSPKLWEAYING
jgi:serine/threonine protein kinase